MSGSSGNQSPVGSQPTTTTYVHADSTCFHDVVQRFTAGPSENKDTIPPQQEITATTATATVTTMTKNDTAGTSPSNSKTSSKPQRPILHERRAQNVTRPTLQISKPENQFLPPDASFTFAAQPPPTLVPNYPQWYGPFSPSIPRYSSSGTTPTYYPIPLSKLSPRKRESPKPDLNLAEEEKAIKERRFYLHPSPRSKPGYTEPQLLTLFPLTSPNATDNKNSLP